MEHLGEKLRKYAEGEDYPYHMPGHKRRLTGDFPKEFYSMDVTEIDGFDDLHAPEGIIKELEERVAKLYGAEESFCLVNGSTAGILSAISAAIPEGGHLLMARNCHKSAYHAAYLRKLQVTYLMPDVLKEFGICDAIRPEQVKEALGKDPSIQAVLIVSPTYEGRISPVREIAKIVHEFGKILIVDEAHGAHLGLAYDRKASPGSQAMSTAGLLFGASAQARQSKAQIAENSCQAGADLVIHSVHKTLPAMTQTALLHVNGDRVDRELLRRFLRIYQSSSPSYVLMASIDNAITVMERDGMELYDTFVSLFAEMTRELTKCRHLRFLAASAENFGFKDGDGENHLLRGDAGQSGREVRQDVGKLVIHAGDSGLSGQQIYDVLREKYHLQLEMAAGEYCLAMFTVGDVPEGYRRMRDALLEIDALADGSREKSGDAAEFGSPLPVAKMSLSEAWDAPWEYAELDSCEGRIAAEFVNLYPPGTPMAAPGEAYTREMLESLKQCLAQGLRLRGVYAENGTRTLKCVRLTESEIE